MTAAEDGGTIYLGTVNAEWPAAEAIEGLAGKTLSLVGIGTEETVIAPNAAEEGAVSFGGLNVTLQNLSVEGQADFADGIVRAENVAFADTAVSNAEADFSHCTLDGTFSVADGSTVVLSQNTFQNDEGSLLFVDDSELTIESGFYTAYGRALQANGSKVTIEDGTFENTTANNLIHLGNTNEDPEVVASELTVNGGTFRSVGYGFTLFGDSSLVFNGGSMQSDMIAISGNNLNEGNTTIEINGGTLEAVITIYMPDAADITVNGGTLIGQSILDMRLGSMNITGQYATTLRATDPDYYPESMTRPGGGASTDGAAFNFHTNNYTDHSSQTENDPGSLTFTLAKGVAVETANGMVASVYDWNGLATEQAVSIDLGDYANDGEAVIYYVANESGTPEKQAILADGVPYASLSAAIAEAGANSMIVMMEDVTETVEISEGKEITLNVNGNILSSDTASTATITNYGTLTLVDTTNCGVITRGETQFYTIVNEGNMTLDGVTIENTTDGVSSLIINNFDVSQTNPAVMVIQSGTYSNIGSNVVKNDEYGILTINGGTFSNSGEGSAVIQASGTTTTINGGLFVKPQAGSSDNIVRIACVNGQTIEVVVTGGTFGSAEVETRSISMERKESMTEDAGKKVTLSISDGTFYGNVGAPGGSGIQSWVDVMKISGGMFYGVIAGANVGTTITGGTFGNKVSSGYLADGYTTVEETDGQGNTLYTVVPEQQP